MAATGLVLEITTDGARVVVAARGEIDLASSDELRAALSQSLRDAPAAMLLDFTDVSFIDSTGVRALLETHEVCRSREIAFEVLPSDRVRKVAETLGVAAALGIDGQGPPD